MMLVGEYREFCKDQTCPSMKDFFQESSYKEKDKVLNYLRNAGTVKLAAAGWAKDVFTGERISEKYVCRQDEEFEWFTDLAYYVSEYNLRLPEEFEKHILTQ